MSVRLTNRRSSSQAARGLRWLCIWALGLVLLAPAQYASAEFFQFSTTFTINGGYAPSGPNAIITGNGTSTVLFNTNQTDLQAPVITVTGNASNTPGDNYDATANGTDIVFANISVPVTSLTTGASVTIPYTFKLTIQDFLTATSVVPNGPAYDFLISGTLTGSVGPGKKVNLSSNTYSPSNVLVATVGTVPVQYTLRYNPYVPPGPGNAGAFGMHVEAVQFIPEPSSFALLSLGALGLAIPALRRWRRKAM